MPLFKQKAGAAGSRATAPRRRRPSRAEGLLKQVHKCVSLLAENPRQAGPQTHEFRSLDEPFAPGDKFFEAYAQDKTPGAYRVFWCYEPAAGEITILAISPHP